MTILEKFRAFVARHLDKKATAAYFLEDVERNILVTFTDKRATVVTEADDGEDAVKHLNYKDVTRLVYHHEKPKSDPLVSSGETLLIQTEKLTVVAACLPYDWVSIEPLVRAGMPQENEDDSGEG